jgi:hypothetical protein
MKRILLFILSIIFFSCNQDYKKLKSRKEDLDSWMTSYKSQLNDRADFIEEIKTLREEFKVKYHYDSLVDIQAKQIEEYKMMDAERKSIQKQMEEMKR